jgi:hypothetical protein
MRKLFEHNIKERQIDFFVLNFNYTTTFRYISKYAMDNYTDEEIHVVDIHGQVNDKSNSIIFVYGDDTSSDYEEIKAHEERELRRHIKSFYYPNTENYKKCLVI